MPGSRPLAPTFGLPPFDNAGVDTILRCGDGVHFRVRSAVLLEASPVFSDMLAAISSEGGENDREGYRSEHYDEKSIIAVTENSDVIDPLLRLIYPITDPVLKDLQDIRPVLAAAMKYQMEEATTVLKNALLSYVETEPLRVWAHACLLRLEEEAMTAARALVGKELPAKAPEELEEVSAGDYYRLTKFLNCRKLAAEAVELFKVEPADIKARPKKSTWSRGDDPLAPFIFRSRPYADINCRSSDGKDFRVHKIILCVASPTLQKKITSLWPEKPPSASEDDVLPVIETNVDTQALGAVLEACYVEPPCYAYDCLTPEYVMSMMVAARKLGMQRLLEQLERYSYATASRDEPLLAYLLAAKMQFPETAKQLVWTLHHDIFNSYGYLPEMESTPAHFYHSLLVNRLKNAPKKGASDAKSGASDASSRTTGAKKVKVAGIHASSCHPWMQNLVDRHMESLCGLDRTLDAYNVSLRYEDILQDSLKEKIWCNKCELNVRAMNDMSESWKKVFDALRQNDYTHNIPK